MHNDTVLCGGAVVIGYTHTTFFDAEFHPSSIRHTGKDNLWGGGALFAAAPGAIRVSCSPSDLRTLRSSYTGLALQPLFDAVRGQRQHFRVGPRQQPISQQHSGPSTAAIVLPDYPNFFHQFGSVAATYAALYDAPVAPHARTRVGGGGGGRVVGGGGRVGGGGGGGGASRARGSSFPPNDLLILALNNASLAPTAAFWSAGLS